MKTPVTSFDVARLAGVSQSAVSRTFTPGASVSKATREKVLEAARKLGYRPNAHARSLITGRSNIIGLVLSDLDNLFYPLALERLAKCLQADGFHVLLFITENNNSDSLIGELLQYNVDGIVLASTTLSSGLAQHCADANIPVVLFNRVLSKDDTGAVSSVRSDNISGGQEVARFMAAAGNRRIAYITGYEESSTSMERERGFREGLAEYGMRVYARAIGNYDFETARRATLELFSSSDDHPDAIFVASDHMAFAVMDTLRHELKLRVPEDVSVVGFDNVPQANWPSYLLTTVEQPLDLMIEATIRLVHRSLADEDTGPRCETVVLPVHLVIRESARKPAK
ncbi:MAG TPA: LacI family DNA-binding transcriptional regulator [Noviherbaspirillum sp.]|uniref:LacI family DNA-binding transcriptional regulator n=1 Tax=Noviherbaspirillum sp. TaxID=1926288 RepID=UPI002B48DF80|nr:LacI family DNA-binding transcriptional regulator [Noviherbaspirillum sp.]HJV88208.1 LacI family DNA-binding transcriptional regulator [Noviherbaspirillum sp.]